ncbi:Osmoprotectant ABC transporter binding protein YehZ [Klebsiella pneumoniae]|nr:Osmoprotectant ABC transporter binding protein YehZ [Klebsiella pneumoniae]
MKMATTWSGALALAALISLPLQAAEPVKVGSKLIPKARCWAI